MKTLLFAFALAPFTVWGQTCNQQVNRNDVVIFIDTNTGGAEIAEARRGACQSGRRFVVIPKNSADHDRILTPWLRAHRQEESACKNDHSSTACQTASARAGELAQQYSQFKSSTNFDLQAAVKSELEAIKNSGAKVSSVILSGHDGGGHFGGMKGDMTRNQIGQLMSAQGLANDVESVILAGCFTAVQAEVNQWKNALPNIKAIYGYDGYAPLADRPAGHQYISSALKNDERIRASASVAQLNARMSSLLPAVANLNAATFVELDCNEQAYMASAQGRRFASVTDGTPAECRAGRAQLSTISATVNRYLEGEAEPPHDPGAMRQMYSQARSLQHCLQPLEINMNVDQVFNMRFHQANETNFALFYAQDLALAEEMLADLPADARGTMWIPNRQNLESKTRAEALANIHQMYNAMYRATNPTHTRALEWLANVSTRHLQALENPFQWHEVTGTSPAAPAVVERLTRQ